MKRKLNKSQCYGYYGGVRDMYVPGDPIDYEKQFFTFSPELIQFLTDNAANIVLRTTLSSEPGNVDTFMLHTSGKPEDVILYQTNNDVVVLDDIAGSGIISDTKESIDGGTF